MKINRTRVGQEFSQHADSYDLHANVQKRVVNRLLSMVRSHAFAHPDTVLDVGCGTGQLLSNLALHYPHTRLYGLDLAFNMARISSGQLGSSATVVNGDAEFLPFAHNVFDLIVSTSTLQWVENFESLFKEFLRVLNPGGLMCTAFFGGRSMKELHECFSVAAKQYGSTADEYLLRMHEFKDVTDVEVSLTRCGAETVSLTTEIETDFYPDVIDLLRSIKRIGAGSSAQKGRVGGLGWRKVLNETSRLYRERYGTNGMIPVTYEVIYVIAAQGDRC